MEGEKGRFCFNQIMIEKGEGGVYIAAKYGVLVAVFSNRYSINKLYAVIKPA
ncbi:MAG: hypothetical protein ACRDD6_06725 [Tannerellaceae bacterium]